MAQRVVTQFISDLSGAELASGEGETIAFSFRGVEYTIDLTDDEAAAFDKSMAVYVEHASKVGGRRKTARGANGNDYNAREVRAWAKNNGVEVPDRGRIPADVVEKYKAAN